MLVAILNDGNVITAENYEKWNRIDTVYCVDTSCRVPVHLVKESKESNKVAFFKTSGRGDSVHKPSCAFANQLSFERAVEKVSMVQEKIISHVEPIKIRLNTNQLDPDYVPKSIDREPNQDVATGKDLKVKNDTKKQAKVISSLKSLKKLFLTSDIDLLASVFISVSGYTLPISDLIIDHATAHQKVITNTALNIPYFVHGQIKQILRLPKVWYLNLYQEEYYFTIVIFERYFKYFTFKDEELLERSVLVMGKLKRNDFNKNRASTEIVIKSDKFIEFLD